MYTYSPEYVQPQRRGGGRPDCVGLRGPCVHPAVRGELGGPHEPELVPAAPEDMYA